MNDKEGNDATEKNPSIPQAANSTASEASENEGQSKAEPEVTEDIQAESNGGDEEKADPNSETDVEAVAQGDVETKINAGVAEPVALTAREAPKNEEDQTKEVSKATGVLLTEPKDEEEEESAEPNAETDEEKAAEIETEKNSEKNAREEVESNSKENKNSEEATETQPKTNYKEDGGGGENQNVALPVSQNTDAVAVCSSTSSSSDSPPSRNHDSGFSLIFEDFVDLQTRLVLMPYIEEEGKGAIVASYPEDDRFEGLLFASTDGEEKQALQTMDFTDILASLREHKTPICLRFEAIEEDGIENEKEIMVNVELSEENEIHDEKKDDDADGEDPTANTPKAGNHESKNYNTNRNADCLNSKSLTVSTSEVETSTISPKPSYLEKRGTTPSREHTKSLNSVLDDHRNRNNSSSKNEGSGRALSSGMFALSAWGMRMKAQSEKLLATASAKTAQQNQQPQPAAKSKLSPKESMSQQMPCDMYVQTNLGTYFPISKTSRGNKPLHFQAVTTSSLYCVRKSAAEACTVGRDTIYKGNPVRYSFQWYRSSTKRKSSRDRFPISPSALYSGDNFDNDSIGDSTEMSRRSRTYSSAESVSSSCSSWSSSSNSSSSCSSYSMSTAGVTQQTFSVASVVTSGTNTTATRTTKDVNSDAIASSWIPLQGATGATFQPNATLVGKKLRCVVTIRPVRGTSSDEEDESMKQGLSAPSSGATMDASDFETNDNDVSALEDDSGFTDGAAEGAIYGNPLGEEKDEGVERIVCDLAIPIQADMILFNGARKAMAVKGSASFGNLVGRGGGTSTNTPTTATSACGKAFRIEVGTTHKIVLYTPPSSKDDPRPRPQRRFMNVNNVHIYCRSSPQDEYSRLTDVPLFQVSARASPKNSKHFDLLFPVIPPPSPIDGDKNGDSTIAEKPSTHRFLSDYCIVDHADSSECGIPRLELEAPNRMTRESFLLALGIASFRGRPAQLDNKKVLYPDDEPILRQARNQQQKQNQPSVPVHSSNNSPRISSQTDSSSPQQPNQQQPQASKASNLKKESDDDSGGRKVGTQVLSGNLNLSPAPPSNVISDSKNVLSPISCQLTPEETPQISGSLGPCPPMPSAAEANLAKVKQLEREMAMLRAKLTRKDKIVTELQRQVQGAEDAHQRTKHVLVNTRQELKDSQEDCERIQMSKRHVERSMQSQHEATQKIESDHKTVVNGLENKLSKQTDKIAELEKLNRALQNEKAVLGATVEARESKLVKLEELQVSNSELSKKVAQQGALEAQLEESHKKHERIQTELESRKDNEIECRKELEAVKSTIETFQKRMQGEKEKASSCQKQLEVVQKKNQQLKGERNSYKQKNESLSKEVARLCRGGKNIREIEKVLADHESLLQETELLRAQKRKALEEAHKYRVSYEQAKAAEEVLSLNPDERETRRILERTAELERLLSEMTDYVSAKQMQLDTMKEINEELQREIHSLAQANLRRDEV